MWQAYYDSVWQAPLPAWIGGLVFLIVLLRQLPFLLAYLVGFTVLSLVGAWLTSGLSPLPMPSRTLAEVFFAAGNDWRFFVLLAHYGLGLTATSALAVSALVSLIVPAECWALSQSISAFSPETPEWQLLHAMSFLALLIIIRVIWRRRAGQPQIQRWLSRLFAFEFWQYAAWAIAYLVVISGSDSGYALSATANFLCSVCFLPFVFLVAPGPLVGRFAVRREKSTGIVGRMVGRRNLH